MWDGEDYTPLQLSSHTLTHSLTFHLSPLFPFLSAQVPVLVSVE